MVQKILVVDDERAIRSTLTDILTFEGFAITQAEDGEDALRKISKTTFDCVICDIKMPKKDGIEVLTEALEMNPDLTFIIISGHGDIEVAVEAVKKGAFDYISKPPDLNRLLITVRNALHKEAIVSENKTLRQKVTKSRAAQMIGKSPQLLKLLETIEKVAPTDARVLITGENGVGKELVAIRLHELSPRKNAALVEVNCAAIPSELIESELFGHEKGSFTSALKMRVGKFEQANGGTLFLDEIGDLSADAQAKMLRALQEGKITRVGGDKDIKVDVRIIAATNKDLLQEVERKKFRMDLYHRLSVIRLQVPALRERVEDIPLLVEHFLETICKEYNHPVKEIDNAAMKAMQRYDWSGNVRELRNAVERLIILSDSGITKKDVEQYIFMR